MSSVPPITCSDLNGVDFNPGEMVIDDVVGYVGYVRNLCTELGTPNDTKEGYQDFLDFKHEIESTHISTFEPDAIDVTHTFESIDLSGVNESIQQYPLMSYFAPFGNGVFTSYSKPVTPFDLPEKGDPMPDRFVTPYDFPDIAAVMSKDLSGELDLS